MLSSRLHPRLLFYATLRATSTSTVALQARNSFATQLSVTPPVNLCLRGSEISTRFCQVPVFRISAPTPLRLPGRTSASRASSQPQKGCHMNLHSCSGAAQAAACARMLHVPAGSPRRHGTAIRNRLAVRIAGSHPADRGSIPRYGSNHVVYSQIWPSEIPVPQYLFAQAPTPGPCRFATSHPRNTHSAHAAPYCHIMILAAPQQHPIVQSSKHLRPTLQPWAAPSTPSSHITLAQQT